MVNSQYTMAFITGVYSMLTLIPRSDTELGTENTLVGKAEVVPACLMTLTVYRGRLSNVTSVPREDAKELVERESHAPNKSRHSEEFSIDHFKNRASGSPLRILATRFITSPSLTQLWICWPDKGRKNYMPKEW